MLQLKIENGFAHLILNSPPANVMMLDFFKEFENLVFNKLQKSDIKALFIYGAKRHFSSGADPQELIDVLSQKKLDKDSFLNRNINTFLAFESLPFTKISIINGCCFGSALELALTCDYRIASKRAVFSFPESEFGLMPGCGGTVRLSDLISKSSAIELILSGRTFSAEEALKIGIIDSIGKKDELLDIAGKLL